MNTIEMDLMQAQLGELTTEVTNNSTRIKKLESGGGGGGESDILVLTLVQLGDTEATTFDKSYTEISNAITNHKLIMLDDTEEEYYVNRVFCGVSESDGYIHLNLPPSIYKGAGNTLTVQLLYYEMNSETSEVTPYFNEYTVATTA